MIKNDQANTQLVDYYGAYFEAKNDTQHVFLREVESLDYPNCALYGLNQLQELVEPVIFTQGQYPFLLSVPKARVCST